MQSSSDSAYDASSGYTQNKSEGSSGLGSFFSGLVGVTIGLGLFALAGAMGGGSASDDDHHKHSRRDR
jgi:hypothetical protein